MRYSCHWGSGLVLGHAHDFFVGIILEVSAEVGGQPLSTAKRVKQLLLHLLPRQEGVEMSAEGWPSAAGTLGIGFGICNTGWHCRRHGRLGVIIIKEQTA